MKLKTDGNITRDLIQNLGKIETVMSQELKELANDTIQRKKARIFTGRGTEGKVMTTKSRRRIGRYGAWHGSNRLKKGLQVDVVDLDYTGTMLESFDIINQTAKTVTIGFKSEYEAEKMEKNEALYGFMIADIEEDIIEKDTNNFFERVNKAIEL